MKYLTIFLYIFLIYLSPVSKVFATAANTKVETTKNVITELTKSTSEKPAIVEQAEMQEPTISSVTEPVNESRSLVHELKNPALIISTFY